MNSKNICLNFDCIYYISNFLIIEDKIKLALICKDYFDLLKLRINKDIRILNIAKKWYYLVYQYKNYENRDINNIIYNLISHKNKKLDEKLLDINNYNIELSKFIDKFQEFIFYNNLELYSITNKINTYRISKLGEILYCIFIDVDNLEYIKIKTFDKLFCLLIFDNVNIKQKIFLPIPIILNNNTNYWYNFYISFNKNAKIEKLICGILYIDKETSSILSKT